MTDAEEQSMPSIAFGAWREDPDDHRALAARRATSAMRELIQTIVTTQAEATKMEWLADQLESLVGVVPPGVTRTRYEGLEPGADSMVRAMATHAIGGPANPIAVPLDLRVIDNTIWAQCQFGAAFEGTPGLVHGGFIAATFDQVLGSAAALSRIAKVTGTLTVKYTRPTPINEPLTFEAAMDHTEGRKVFVSGRLTAKGKVTAEATGIFIEVDVKRFIPQEYTPPTP